MNASDMRGPSALMLSLAERASDRLSLTQMAFFFLAAHADVKGSPVTRSMLLKEHDEVFKGSVRNSYRQLLEPARRYPKGLGWLTTEENPEDSREQFLRLTSKGRAVLEEALAAQRG